RGGAGALLRPLRLAQLVHSDALAVRGARRRKDLAGEGGMPPDHLDPSLEGPTPSAALEALQARPHAFDLFAALRLLEQSCADRPRLGESRRAADDIARLGQAPHLSFAPSDVASVARDEQGRLRLEQFGFGVFGPNGALPLHLTELAYERR